MRFLALLLLLLPTATLASGELPLGWTHTYLDSIPVSPDSTAVSVVEVTFASAPVDTCVYRDAENVCQLEYPDMVSATWSGGVDDGLRQWFCMEGSTPEEREVLLVGFDRPGVRGFYSDPLPYVPAPQDQVVGTQWNWSATYPAGDPSAVTFQAVGSVVAVDEVVTTPFRPAGRPALRVQLDDTPAQVAGLRLDAAGHVVTGQRKAPLVRWFTTVNGTTCVLLRDEKLVLESVVDEGQEPVGVTPRGFGALKSRY